MWQEVSDVHMCCIILFEQWKLINTAAAEPGLSMLGVKQMKVEAVVFIQRDLYSPKT